MLKLAHQFQSEVLFQDDYLRWFFDDSVVRSLQQNPLEIEGEPQDETAKFQQIAYWYVILREKYGDGVIEAAIASGCRQVVLLGSGYDTRFFRLPSIQQNSIKVFEVDLPETIQDKEKCLIQQLGEIPENLFLIPLNLSNESLDNLARLGWDSTVATVYLWQGVSYYLTQNSVSQLLDYIKTKMTQTSIFAFDCCSPLMTFKNEVIPGIASNIDHLTGIGEPYQFGMEGEEMKDWLAEKGFQDIQILQQADLEENFLHRRTLPDRMWYVVRAGVG